jgi:hypothetical protein
LEFPPPLDLPPSFGGAIADAPLRPVVLTESSHSPVHEAVPVLLQSITLPTVSTVHDPCLLHEHLKVPLTPLPRISAVEP